MRLQVGRAATTITVNSIGLGDYFSVFGYNIVIGPGDTTITDTDPSDGDTGTDTLIDVEQAVFSDDDADGDGVEGLITIHLDGTNNAALAVKQTLGGFNEDATGSVTSAELLANDLEFDGESIVVTAVDSTSTQGDVIVNFNPDGTVVSIDYDPRAAFNHLAEGEMAADSHGATSNLADITVTVTGTNDAPTVSATTVVVDEGGSVQSAGQTLGFEDLESAASSSGAIASGYKGFTWEGFSFGETDEPGTVFALTSRGYRQVALATGSDNVAFTSSGQDNSTDPRTGIKAVISRAEAFSFDGLVLASAFADGDPAVGDGSQPDFDTVTITGYLDGVEQGSLTVDIDRNNPLAIDLLTAAGLSGSFSNIDSVEFTHTFAWQMVMDDLQFGAASVGAIDVAALGDDVDSDDDGASLTYEIVSGPAKGAVVNNGDGTFTYDPQGDFLLLDDGQSEDVTFTYRAIDSHGAASAAETVTVTVTGTSEAIAPILSLPGGPSGGDMDVLVAGFFSSAPTTVLLNDGAGNLTSTGQVFSNLDHVRGMDAGDLNGDGYNDTITANDTTGARVYFNNSDGTFTQTESLSNRNGWDADIANLDGDGDLDVYLSYWSGLDEVWLNDGSGNLVNSGQNLGTLKSRTAVIADLDDDGDLDIFVINNLTTIGDYIWLNNGDGTFDPASPVTVAGNAGISVSVISADLDDSGNSALTTDKDTAFALNITASLVDLDGSETLGILIEGVPAGATLNNGADNGDGSWTLTAADLAGLTLTPAQDALESITLTVTATATDVSNGDTASTSGSFTITINPVNAAPVVAAIALTGIDETTDTSAIELSQLERDTDPRGFVINGVSSGDRSGISVSAAGDVNGDDPNGINSGASFVVFGKADGTAVELSAFEVGIGGFVINGVSADDRSGFSVSAAGDGFDDLIVGAILDDPNGLSSGASFVIFGGNFSAAATQIGTVGDDVIFAGTGNDTIDGAGGTDRLSGGQGADTFVFNDLGATTTVIDFEGGLGVGDQLDVSAFGFADFAAFQAVATASGPGGHDTLIQLDLDDSILLEDFDVADLNADDVIL